MVVPLPLGPGLNMDEMEPEVPPVVRTKIVPFWWVYLFLLVATGVVSFIARDYVGGIMDVLFAMIIGCMVRNRCERMNQCMLLWTGMLFVVEGLFDLINLCSVLAGRNSTHVSTQRLPTDNGDGKTVITTITTVKHPFFDHEQGWVYNLQSAMYIVHCVIMALGAALCIWTYNNFSTNLLQGAFGDEEGGEVGPGMARPYQVPSFSGTGYGISGEVRRPGQDQGRPPTQLFGGQGNRLGG